MYAFLIKTINMFNHICIGESQIVTRKIHLFLFILTAGVIPTPLISTPPRVSLAFVFIAFSLNLKLVETRSFPFFFTKTLTFPSLSYLIKDDVFIEFYSFAESHLSTITLNNNSQQYVNSGLITSNMIQASRG